MQYLLQKVFLFFSWILVLTSSWLVWLTPSPSQFFTLLSARLLKGWILIQYRLFSSGGSTAQKDTLFLSPPSRNSALPSSSSTLFSDFQPLTHQFSEDH